MFNFWQDRLHNADKAYKEWESKFKCETLERYWEGEQWKGKKDFFNIAYNPYTINLLYSTIKIKLASLIFQNPSYITTPRPGKSDWNLDLAVQSAQKKQDVLNTLVQNPNAKFTNNTKLSCLDSFFRFGLLEVGYAADWRNPLKSRPLLSDDNDDVENSDTKVIRDEEVPINERMYFRRINPRRFRVSVTDYNELDQQDWCGYYEFYYTKYLKKIKGITTPTDLDDARYISSDRANTLAGYAISGSKDPDIINLLASGSITKVWHIWDIVAGKRILLDDNSCKEMWSGDFERLPLIDLRWDLRTTGWFPMPPAFQWLSPQDEINEAREQTRSFRRRFTRKFQVVKGGADPEAQEKFVSGPDGVLIEVNQLDAISPISNPEQGPTAENALIIAKDDFNIISGTSAESRGGQSDRETATHAKIVDARSQIRESAEQLDFSSFLIRIGRETLAQATEKLTAGIWAKSTADPGDVGEEMQANGPVFNYIMAQDLSDGYDQDIDIDITNATPAAMQQQEAAFNKFIILVTQFPLLSTSPTLMREAAFRSGYRNEKVIRQMQQAIVISMAAKANAQQAATNNANDPNQSIGPGNDAKTLQKQQQVPGTQDLQAQLSNQVQ